MSTAGKIIKTELICPECAGIQKIQRLKRKQKQLFHVKDLYCPICQKITKHIEVKDHFVTKMYLENLEELTDEEEFVLGLLKDNSHFEKEKVLNK